MVRRELAAVLAYSSALQRLRDEGIAPVLGRILENHRSSLRLLTATYADVSDPCTDAPTAGLDESTSMLNPEAQRALLDALIREETLAERLYRGCLENGDFSDQFRFLLGARLLPERQRDRALLELAIAAAAHATAEVAMSAG
jgi:hypothetical protein